MPKYKQVEFAALCGISKANLSTYKSRKKIEVGPDGLIDTALEINANFLLKCQEKNEDSTKAVIVSAKPKEKTDTSIEPTQKAPLIKEIYVQSSEEGSLNDLEKRKKKIDIENAEAILKLKQMEIERQQGLSIAVDDIKVLMSTHTSSISTSFRQVIRDYLLMIGKKKGFTPTEMATYRKQFDDMLNTAIDNAIAQSKKRLKQIQESNVKP